MVQHLNGARNFVEHSKDKIQTLPITFLTQIKIELVVCLRAYWMLDAIVFNPIQHEINRFYFAYFRTFDAISSSQFIAVVSFCWLLSSDGSSK